MGPSAHGSPRTVSADRYHSADFLERERRRVFGRGWLMATGLWAVAQPGDYTTVTVLGTAVIVLRDLSGTVRAFLNTCRHRGTSLLSGSGNVRAIRCPYHDWKYALDGRLRHIPGEEDFLPLDKDTLGLAPVRCEVGGGFVWLCFSDETPALAASAGPIFDEVAPHALHEMRPIDERWSTVACNWKSVLDNATESYHIPAVHGASVNRVVNTRAEFLTYGDHYRLTLPIAHYGFRHWLDRACARGGPYTDKQLSVLHKYVIFPNFLMNVLPYHLTVFQVWPDGPNRTHFFYGFYERQGARGLEWLRARATWAASRLIWAEDERILSRHQAGVASLPGGAHHFHQDEQALAHFHGVLDAWMR